MKQIWRITAAVATIAAPAVAGDVVPAATGGRTYVQHEILQEKARHPEIESIVVYGVRNPTEGPVIIGSTIDQASVFRKADVALSDERLLPAADGYGLIVRTGFRSRTDRPIGMIEIRFRRDPGVPDNALRIVARQIGANLARNTYSAQNAIDPFPFDPGVSGETYAQTLVRQVTAAHPEIAVMMIHAASPGSGRNIVIASNVGRIGKAGDEDDMKVADEGADNLGLNADGDQYETEIPLLDAQRRRIGALGLVFPYRSGDDKDALLRRAVAIRDELAKNIADRAQLFAAGDG